jgi:two-component system chemotaxis response regulator CheB
MNLLLIGASAGSIDTIEKLLTAIDTSKAVTLLAVHMGDSYLSDFVSLLKKRSGKRVELLEEFVPLEPRTIYLCNTHHSYIDVCHGNNRLYVRYNRSERSIYKPDIDYLFTRVSESELARRSAAILLSGIGSDGAKGLRSLKLSGALTLVMDEKCAPIYGIPRAAIEIGAHCKIVDVKEAAKSIERFWNAGLPGKDQTDD